MSISSEHCILFPRSKFSFLLSTTSENGILIISFNKKTTVFDYEILYLEGGKVKYTFNAGSGPSMIVSDSKVNDGEWHSITTTRKAKNGRLTVDGTTASGKSPGKLSSMNSIIKLYVGGAPAKLTTFEKIPVCYLLSICLLRVRNCYLLLLRRSSVLVIEVAPQRSFV